MISWLKIGVFSLTLGLAHSALAGDVAVLRNGFTIRHERRVPLGSVVRLYTSLRANSYVDIPVDQIERYDKDDTPAPPAPIVTPPSAQPAASASAHQPTTSQPRGGTGPPPQLPLFTAQNLNDAVNAASDKTMVDPALISSVIRAESGFNPRAVSPKGAQGLMQLMPQTATNLGVPNAFDPKSNVDGGTRYLRWLLERYNYDLVKALAAYNAGPQRVEQYRGVPPYHETRAYVARIIRDFNRKKLAEQKAAAAAARAKQTKSASAAGSTPTRPSSKRQPTSSAGTQ